jgi:hypothetical protein
LSIAQKEELLVGVLFKDVVGQMCILTLRRDPRTETSKRDLQSGVVLNLKELLDYLKNCCGKIRQLVFKRISLVL